MTDEAIELLTKMLIEENFKNKKENKTGYAKITKVDLYRLCIDLLNLIKKVENNNFDLIESKD